MNTVLIANGFREAQFRRHPPHPRQKADREQGNDFFHGRIPLGSRLNQRVAAKESLFTLTCSGGL